MKALIVALWAGERRVVGCQPIEILEGWQEMLKRFPHKLDAVVLVSNISSFDTPEYCAALLNFSIQTPLLVMRRANVNGSYGAFKHAWNVLGERFDWYYIFEDDYRPNLPNWDDILLSYMTDKDAYVGARLSRAGEGYPIHMSHCCGLMRQQAFASIKVDQHTRGAYDPGLQIDFTQDLVNDRWEFKDVTDKYSIPFRTNTALDRELGNEQGPALIVPMEHGWT